MTAAPEIMKKVVSKYYGAKAVTAAMLTHSAINADSPNRMPSFLDSVRKRYRQT